MTLILLDFLLIEENEEDVDDDASMASGFSLVELSFDVDDDDDVDFVTTAICCVGLKTTIEI